MVTSAHTGDAAERQLTRAAHGHVLTNVNAWSPDSRRIVYDVRSVDSVFDGDRIEDVDAETGEVRVLYRARDGAKVGVATWHPREPKVAFIHGPERPTADWSYGMTRRRGAIVDTRQPDLIRPLDAMTYAPPYVPGALRGGSHVHVFRPDGGAASFTYDDEVLARLGPAAPGAEHEVNQRNVAVAFPAEPDGIRVPRTHPRNHDGDWFSAVVTRTVTVPRPGSDEIGRAYEEGWVKRPGGRWSLAFLGNVVASDGREVPEVFLVDLPDDLRAAGDGPLEGTAVRRPAPPRGTVQRRLTFTTGRKHPGAVTTPRHWVRAAPDGSALAFLMKDDGGIVQLWTVAPEGGEPRQVSRHASGVASAFTWTPDGRAVAHVMDGSVFLTEVATGRASRVTPRAAAGTEPLPLACVVSPDGRSVAYQRPVTEGGQTWPQVFVAALPGL